MGETDRNALPTRSGGGLVSNSYRSLLKTVSNSLSSTSRRAISPTVPPIPIASNEPECDSNTNPSTTRSRSSFPLGPQVARNNSDPGSIRQSNSSSSLASSQAYDSSSASPVREKSNHGRSLLRKNSINERANPEDETLATLASAHHRMQRSSSSRTLSTYPPAETIKEKSGNSRLLSRMNRVPSFKTRVEASSVTAQGSREESTSRGPRLQVPLAVDDSDQDSPDAPTPQLDDSPKPQGRNARFSYKPRLSLSSLENFEDQVKRLPCAAEPKDSLFCLQDESKIHATEFLLRNMVVTDSTRHDNPMVYVSDGFERLSGYAREDLLGRNCNIMQGSETDEKQVKLLCEALASKRSWIGILLNYRKPADSFEMEGEAFKCLLYIRPVVDTTGRVQRCIGLQFDVTNGTCGGQPVDDKLLRSMEERLKAALEGVFVTEPLVEGNRIQCCTPGYERLTGYSFADMEGSSWLYEYGPGTASAALQRFSRAIHESRPMHAALLAHKRDGSPYWVYTMTVPLMAGNVDGRASSHLWIKGDVTSSKTMRIRGYHLGRILGQGASGTVRVARVSGSQELVAIKIVDARKFSSIVAIERIQEEIRILESIKHKHIINMREVLFLHDKFYFVMEYAEGGCMTSLLTRGRLLEERARELLCETCLGLEYCHRRNVVHRDLKSENLLLDKDGHVKVADFGLSTILNPADQDMSLICGTPAFAAPEIFLRQQYTDAVDVWSLGVILYELTTGAVPFHQPTSDDLKRAVVSGEYHEPAYLSDPLLDLLRRMLTVDPAKRATLDEVMRHPWVGLREPHDDCCRSSTEITSPTALPSRSAEPTEKGGTG
eukprot:CAMPEP_0118939268 /NCGR_PEP_ID=MMETSP1169-20130426/28417_1 /TAXON_ID=36882 /ORGANISM="Pyramimonas obovata, Strain CCMP722" /LENGTH=832 /DNA_ID=CAMNT_0006883491 /DNA_START=442 /DNA_END=2937 /DNA_ORIENTATION=-